MAKCPKCENDVFDLEEYKFKDIDFGYLAVCCAKCNTVITFMEDRNVTHHLLRMQEMLAKVMISSGISFPLGDQQNINPYEKGIEENLHKRAQQ